MIKHRYLLTGESHKTLRDAKKQKKTLAAQSSATLSRLGLHTRYHPSWLQLSSYPSNPNTPRNAIATTQPTANTSNTSNSSPTSTSGSDSKENRNTQKQKQNLKNRFGLNLTTKSMTTLFTPQRHKNKLNRQNTSLASLTPNPNRMIVNRNNVDVKQNESQSNNQNDSRNNCRLDTMPKPQSLLYDRLADKEKNGN